MNNRPDFHDDSMFHDDSILARFFGKSSNYTDIPNSMFKTYNVKKGLRNDDGTGVRIGLTKVCDVVGYQEGPDGSIIPCEGDLTLRGYSLKDLVKNRYKHYGYEEMVFLLLFGFLPDRKEFDNFRKCLSDRYDLPADFLTNDILQMPSENLMNKLQSCTISLYNYAQEPDAQDVYQTLLKGIDMVAKFPSIVCYSYFAKMHHFYRQSLIIHYPRPEYSIAENILYMLRPDGKFTDKEASVLDGILMIHSEHGGGNNSTFTNVVMGSTGTDLYSAVCGSIGSLKGPKHGGANLSVSRMMQQIIADTHYSCDEKLLRGIVESILDKDYFDNSGLVYGFGHAVLSTRSATPDASCCAPCARRLPRSRAAPIGSASMPPSKKWSKRSSARGRASRSAQMWTIIPVLPTTCSASRKTCSHRSSPSPASRDGSRTTSRTRCMTERSCGPRPNTSESRRSTCR